MNDQRYYEIVAGELQNRIIRPGLWTRAVAETGNEESAARALYIRFRVAELEQQETAEKLRTVAEAHRRSAEEARAKKEQHEAELRRQKEEEKRREQEKEAEQLRIECERAASPYAGIWVVVAVIGLLVLLFVLGSIFPK